MSTHASHQACEACGIDPSTINPTDAVVALRSFPRRWRAVFALAAEDDGEDGEDDAEELLRRRPDPATWSAVGYACHVRDVFELYDERVRRTLVEHRPSLPGVDPDRWAAERDYDAQPPGRVLDQLAERALALADRFDGVAGEDWMRVALVEGHERSVLWWARQAAHEGSHHLRDAERSLAAARRASGRA